jgi:CRISPR-associated exonuclease Cas4
MGLGEDDLLPLSALQHLLFCERQCALIHVEQAWRDNPLTLEGSHLHVRVHDGAPRREVRGDVVISRGLAIRSFRLGVAGVADVVEFHRAQEASNTVGGGPHTSTRLVGAEGWWRPLPVEYKRGKPKISACDRVQLCAQAMCLEEMLCVCINGGALFYARTQHRHEIAFDPGLRRDTEAAALRLHELIASRRTPRARRQPGCRRCSLLDVCRPDAMAPRRSARRFVAEMFEAWDVDRERAG